MDLLRGRRYKYKGVGAVRTENRRISGDGI